MLVLLTEGARFLVSGDSSSYLEAYKYRRLANNDNQDRRPLERADQSPMMELEAMHALTRMNRMFFEIRTGAF
jgi:hypothetical protein